VVTFENLVTNNRSVLCVKVFTEISGGGCSNTQNTPPVTALTGSVATEQRRPQSGRLQDPGDRGIDQSISDSAQSGIGVLKHVVSK